jgi:hypothetical protein
LLLKISVLTTKVAICSRTKLAAPHRKIRDQLSSIHLADGVVEMLVYLVATSVSLCSGYKESRSTMARVRRDSVRILAL